MKDNGLAWAESVRDAQLPPELHNPAICSQCGLAFDRSDALEINGDILCEDCLTDYCMAHTKDFGEAYITYDADTSQRFSQFFWRWLAPDERVQVIEHVLFDAPCDDVRALKNEAVRDFCNENYMDYTDFVRSNYD